VLGILRAGGETTLRRLSEEAGVGTADVTRLAQLLDREGLARMAGRRVRLLRRDVDAADVPLDAEERRRAYERSRLEMMRGYAETDACRHRYVVNYFGQEPAGGQCAMCDNDARAGRGAAPEPGLAAGEAAVRFALGDRVRHAKWGPGVVQGVADGRVTVLFEEVGYRTLAASVVAERDVLERLPSGSG